MLLLGLAVIVTLWRNHAVKPATPPLQTNQKILAFGDSLTHGYGAVSQTPECLQRLPEHANHTTPRLIITCLALEKMQGLCILLSQA